MIGKNELYKFNIEALGAEDREATIKAFLSENGYEYNPSRWAEYVKCDSIFDGYEIIKSIWKEL